VEAVTDEVPPVGPDKKYTAASWVKVRFQPVKAEPKKEPEKPAAAATAAPAAKE